MDNRSENGIDNGIDIGVYTQQLDNHMKKMDKKYKNHLYDIYSDMKDNSIQIFGNNRIQGTIEREMAKKFPARLAQFSFSEAREAFDITMTILRVLNPQRKDTSELDEKTGKLYKIYDLFNSNFFQACKDNIYNRIEKATKVSYTSNSPVSSSDKKSKALWDLFYFAEKIKRNEIPISDPKMRARLNDYLNAAINASVTAHSNQRYLIGKFFSSYTQSSRATALTQVQAELNLAFPGEFKLAPPAPSAENKSGNSLKF